MTCVSKAARPEAAGRRSHAPVPSMATPGLPSCAPAGAPQLSEASGGSLLRTAAVFALTAVSPSLLGCSGLRPGCNVMGLESSLGRKAPGVRSLAAASALVLAVRAQLHLIPFKLQAALKCSRHFPPDIPHSSLACQLGTSCLCHHSSPFPVSGQLLGSFLPG